MAASTLIYSVLLGLAATVAVPLSWGAKNVSRWVTAYSVSGKSKKIKNNALGRHLPKLAKALGQFDNYLTFTSLQKFSPPTQDQTSVRWRVQIDHKPELTTNAFGSFAVPSGGPFTKDFPVEAITENEQGQLAFIYRKDGGEQDQILVHKSKVKTAKTGRSFAPEDFLLGDSLPTAGAKSAPPNPFSANTRTLFSFKNGTFGSGWVHQGPVGVQMLKNDRHRALHLFENRESGEMVIVETTHFNGNGGAKAAEPVELAIDRVVLLSKSPEQSTTAGWGMEALLQASHREPATFNRPGRVSFFLVGEQTFDELMPGAPLSAVELRELKQNPAVRRYGFLYVIPAEDGRKAFFIDGPKGTIQRLERTTDG